MNSPRARAAQPKPARTTSAAHPLIVRLRFIEARAISITGGFEMSIPITPEATDVKERNREVAILYRAGKYDEAIPVAESALSLAEKTLGPGHSASLESLANLAELYRIKGDYKRAEPLMVRALSGMENAEGPWSSQTASCASNLGRLYRDKGDFVQAESLYQRALAIREKVLGPEHPDTAQSLNNLGTLYDAEGDYSRAEPFFQRALSIREKVLPPENPLIASTLNNLAQNYRARGDYPQAELLYLRAIDMVQHVENAQPQYATTLDNLGQLYREKGDYDRAEPLCQKALSMRETIYGPEHPQTTWSLNNLALIYRYKGDYQQAEPLFRRVLAIDEKDRPGHPDTARALANLADIYRDKRDYQQAEPLFRRALAIDENALGPEHPDTANSVSNLGLVYLNKGDYQQAEGLLERALAINEKVFGLEHPTTVTALANLGLVHWIKGERKEAALYLSRGSDAREQSLTLILTTGSEQQKKAYLSTLELDTPLAISFHAQFAPDDPDALSLAFLTVLRRKGRLLEAVAAETHTLRERLNPDDQKLLDELLQMRTLHANMVMRGPGERNLTEYQQEIQKLRIREDQIEAAISLRNAAFRVHSEPVTLKTIQESIPHGAALVELVYYQPLDPKADLENKALQPPRYAAYVLFHDGQPAWTDLGEAQPIDRLALQLRGALSNPGRTDVKLLARELDEKVMRPLRALLGSQSQVLLSPDGQLNLVPFAALVDERQHYLLDHYTFSYLGSGRDLLRLQAPASSRQGALVLANPDYDAKPAQAQAPAQAERAYRSTDFQMYFQPLPGTAQEGERLQKLLRLPKSAVLTGARANEGALKGVSGPRLLHIATHGFFLADQPQEAPNSSRAWVDPQAEGGLRPLLTNRENPLLRSGLALAGANVLESGSEDGVLTALEVSGLDLWGTQLVVLSACETGIGDVANGEGVYGLRRALVLAGSRAQVMSLWSVDDAATRDLMVGLYRRLLKKEGLSESLRGVQREMLAAKKQKHPYYWAAFIPSGESRALGE
jgi:CHAT domain-containing protein/Tfp pilus assembly protein PilF